MAINFDEYLLSREEDRRYLFHYTNEYIALEKILSFNKLRFSKRTNSHDPIEKQNLNHVFIDFNTPEMIQYESEINKIRDSVKYCCFCVDKEKIDSYPFEKGCFRSRMWSQYANSHQGICLVFNYKKIFEKTLNYFDSPNGWAISSKVSYVDDDKDIIDTMTIHHKDLSPPDERLKKLCNVYLFSKLKDYEHENEYRICINDNNCTELIDLDFKDSLEGIVIGHFFNPIYKQIVHDFAKGYNVPVKQVNWYNRIPSLENIGV